MKTHSKEMEMAINKIVGMLKNFKEVIDAVISDKSMVRDWVENLILVQTYIGIKFQEAILKKTAQKVGKDYRLATPKEESGGIDGFINNTPVSIKPSTYKLEKNRLEEKIKAKIVYYEKLDKGIEFEFDLDDFK